MTQATDSPRAESEGAAEQQDPTPAATDEVTAGESRADEVTAGESREDERPPAVSPQQAPVPETGDLVIDAALRDLAQAQGEDLDARLSAGERVQQTLRSRLNDLGG